MIDRLKHTNYAHQKKIVAEKNSPIEDLGSSCSLDEKSSEGDLSKAFHDERFVSQDAGWSRLAKYYRPCSTICLGAVLAILNSLQFVILAAFILAYHYLYSNWYDEEITGGEPEIWRNKITFTFLVYLFFMCLINSSERSLFGIMGE